MSTYFSASRQLQELSQHAGRLASLDRFFRKAAPPALLQASRVIWLERQILTIAADNGAVAAKLRQLAPELVKRLQANGAEVTGIRIRVQVASAPRAYARAPRCLSSTGQQQLAHLAGTLADSPLKSALERLVTESKR